MGQCCSSVQDQVPSSGRRFEGRQRSSSSASAVVKRHHPVDGGPADGTLLWLRQGVMALGAGTHVTALQKDAGALPAQTHSAAGRGHAAFLDVQFPQALPLLLLELLQHAPLLLALSAVNVSPPYHEEERGAGGEPKHQGQNPPQPDAVHLLLQERLVVLPAEKVAETLFWGLELDEVVIQDQLSHSGDTVAHLQHLLSLMDALGSLAADEVTDDVGQGLDCGVEVLVGGLQVQLCSI